MSDFTIHTHSLHFRNYKVTFVISRSNTLKTFVRLLVYTAHEIVQHAFMTETHIVNIKLKVIN